jgi:hypothetical protein
MDIFISLMQKYFVYPIPRQFPQVFPRYFIGTFPEWTPEFTANKIKSFNGLFHGVKRKYVLRPNINGTTRERK